MIKSGDRICPKCNGELIYRDTVKRIVKLGWEKHKILYLERFKCINCGSIHRELPDCIIAYKHYHSEIITGVIEGLITSDTLGYDIYPCEKTMERWMEWSRNKQLV